MMCSKSMCSSGQESNHRLPFGVFLHMIQLCILSHTLWTCVAATKSIMLEEKEGCLREVLMVNIGGVIEPNLIKPNQYDDKSQLYCFH